MSAVQPSKAVIIKYVMHEKAKGHRDTFRKVGVHCSARQVRCDYCSSVRQGGKVNLDHNVRAAPINEVSVRI